MATVTVTKTFTKTREAVKLPSQENDAYWIWQDGPPHIRDKGPTLGKWLVFKHKSCIDQVWEKIKKATASGELGATASKVSTMRENPNASNPAMKVICVFTTAEDIDEVGLKLIFMVKQTIRYKKDDATYSGIYSNRGFNNISCKTLEWNKGDPKFKEMKK